jgi:WD40 repeat protein
VAFSPSGDHIACFLYGGSKASGIAILDWKGEMKNLLSTGSRFQANRFVFSPNGRHLLSAGPDGHVRFWKDWKLTPSPTPIKEYPVSVLAITFTPNGKYSVASSGADSPTIDVFDLNGSLAGQFKGLTDRVLALAVSRDGSRLVSLDAGRFSRSSSTLRLWDFDRLKLLKTIEIGVQLCGAFSRDARFAIVGNSKGAISIYDVHTGEKIKTWETARSRRITTVAISADSRFALSGGQDAKVRYWGLPAVMHMKPSK